MIMIAAAIKLLLLLLDLSERKIRTIIEKSKKKTKQKK